MTIKEARTKTNRPAEEIAKLLGFPLKTWLAWEEGERKPPQYIEQLILERLEKMNKSWFAAGKIDALWEWNNPYFILRGLCFGCRSKIRIYLGEIWGRFQKSVAFWGIKNLEGWHLSYHFKLFNIIIIFRKFIGFIHCFSCVFLFPLAFLLQDIFLFRKTNPYTVWMSVLSSLISQKVTAVWSLPQISPTWILIFLQSSKTAPKERPYPIFVASEQRLDVSG